MESELRNHQQGAPDRCQRQVHLARGVRKDPQANHPIEDVVGVRFGIAAAHAEQNHEALPDLSECTTLRPHFGSCDPLNNCTHSNVL